MPLVRVVRTPWEDEARCAEGGGSVGRERKVLIILCGFVKPDKSYDRLAAVAHQQETRLDRAVEIKHPKKIFRHENNPQRI